MILVTSEVKNQLGLYIKLLNEFLENQPKDIEIREWIPNCIECLQFALDNEKLLEEKPSLHADTINTINLLYDWIVENKQWAYIVLRQKFRTVYSSEECGKDLKTLVERMGKERALELAEGQKLGNDIVNFTDENGNFKSTEQILYECSILWNQVT